MRSPSRVRPWPRSLPKEHGATRFADKVAIVTGAASGIGEATARLLAAEGASVVLADIQDAAGAHVSEEIQRTGGTARYQHCDVASLGDWKALASDTIGQFDRIDIVHNTAYTIVRGPTHELDERDWNRQIDVCLKQVFLSVKTCIPHLIESQGVMINTSSVHAHLGFSQHAAYDAAKGAISALTRQLAVEYGPEVRVNAVLPGGILTAAWEGVSKEDIAHFANQAVAKRLGHPAEVAAAVAFLASEDASYITGEGIVVDGGWSITREQ
jgi:NAD(P)-dependent dehydrogenase (short-subunit alcohol dehydrogenase family)